MNIDGYMYVRQDQIDCGLVPVQQESRVGNIFL